MSRSFLRLSGLFTVLLLFSQACTSIGTPTPAANPTIAPATIPSLTDIPAATDIPAPTPLPPTIAPPTAEPPPTAVPTELIEPTQAIPVVQSVPQSAAAPRHKPGDAITLDLIAMKTRMEGWGISGGDVLTTVDGGKSWHEATPPEVFPADVKVQAYGAFLDIHTAWIIFAANGQINPNASVWHTADSGRTWTPGTSLNHQAYGDTVWAEFAVLDAQNIWLMVRGVYVGAGTHHDHELFRSVDGGLTWASLDGQTFDDYTGMVFADAQNGLRTLQTIGAYAPAPPAYDITSDGGATWQTRELPTPPGAPDLFTRHPYCETYHPVMSQANSIRMLVGCFDYKNPPDQFAGYFYSSQDGGASWLTAPLPVKIRAEQSQMIYFDANQVLILGRDAYLSVNDGQQWKYIKSVNWDGQFSFSDPQYGWAVARSNNESVLVSTTDGASSWKIIKPAISH
jgi:photosystem II stability/assembly factor-like uncharacterized protein